MSELLIDRVLADLTAIIDRTREEESRLGYFAALYRRVTEKVKEGILSGFFDDGPRMDRLDFTFASRYLDALATFEAGGSPTACWRLAFDAAGNYRPIILQQLVVGINAHINLDLGIAAARVAPGGELPSLHDDFNRINQILAGLVSLVERQIGELSPWFAFLARVAGEKGVRVVEFSMNVARDEAWAFAHALAPLDEGQQAAPIARRDGETEKLGRKVLHPGWLLDAVAFVVRLRETNDVRRVIDTLAAPAPPVEVVAAEGRKRLARDSGDS